MNRRSFLTSALAFGAFAALDVPALTAKDKGRRGVGRVVRTDEEWRRRLTPRPYEVTRRGGTGRPGSGPRAQHYARGPDLCVCCGVPPFSAKAK